MKFQERKKPHKLLIYNRQIDMNKGAANYLKLIIPILDLNNTKYKESGPYNRGANE